jgi:hypothetical protein
VETTAEDIKFLGRFQGTPGLDAAEAFAFYSPKKILLRSPLFVKREAKEAFDRGDRGGKAAEGAKKTNDKGKRIVWSLLTLTWAARPRHREDKRV